MEIKQLRNKELKLTNDGKLTLFFIGVGSAFTKRLSQTNLLIIKGKDHLLVDCGTRTPQTFVDLGLPITNVRNFLITHSHADHIGGLEEVVLMCRYVVRKKPVIYITKEYQEILWNMSLKGGSGFNERKKVYSLSFKDFWEPVRPQLLKNYPRETYELDVGSINIKMIRTKHIPDSSESWKDSFWSCGLVIDNKVLFTADTRFDYDLIDSFEKRFNFENIFHDCQFFTGGVHASIEELNQFPPKIKKKMYLEHYGDNWEDFKDKVSEYGFAGFARQQIFYIFD